MAKNKNKKVRKAVSVAGVTVKIVLFLIGIALLAFFVWVGISVWKLFGF